MAINIVNVDDMKTGRGGGGKNGEKYSKYRIAIQKSLPTLKELIANNGTIRVKHTEITKEMGREFEKLSPTSIQWAMKYVLFNEGIYATAGKTKTDEPVLILRFATEKDALPESLAKFNVVPEGEGEGEGTETEGAEEEADDDNSKEETK